MLRWEAKHGDHYVQPLGRFTTLLTRYNNKEEEEWMKQHANYDDELIVDDNLEEQVVASPIIMDHFILIDDWLQISA